MSCGLIFFLEFLVAKFLSVLFSLFIVGFAHAADIQDAPIGDSNYVGIIVFLVLMFGGGGWFIWKLMRDKKDQDQGKK